MIYGWVLYVTAMVYPVGPTPYYHPAEPISVSYDYLTAEECYRAQGKIYSNVLADRSILRGGWITGTWCQVVDVEPNN